MCNQIKTFTVLKLLILYCVLFLTGCFSSHINRPFEISKYTEVTGCEQAYGKYDLSESEFFDSNLQKWKPISSGAEWFYESTSNSMMYSLPDEFYGPKDVWGHRQLINKNNPTHLLFEAKPNSDGNCRYVIADGKKTTMQSTFRPGGADFEIPLYRKGTLNYYFDKENNKKFIIAKKTYRQLGVILIIIPAWKSNEYWVRIPKVE